MSLVHNCFSSKRRRGEFQDIRTRGGGGVGFRETDHEEQNGPAHEPNFTHQPLTTRSRPSTRGQFQRPGTMLIPSMMQANSTLPPGPYYSWPGHRDAVPPRGTNVAIFGVRLFKKKVWGQQYLLLGQQMHSLFLPPSDRPSQNKTTHTTSQAIIFLQRVTTFRFIIQRVSKQQQSVIQQISCKNVGSQYKQIAWDPGFPDKSRHVDTRNLAN